MPEPGLPHDAELPSDARLWMGLNWAGLSLDEAHVAVVGAPYDGSVSHERGAAQAPGVLRRLSLGRRPHTENGLSLAGLRLRDLGDAAVDDGDAWATQQAIAAAVRPAVGAGAIPLVLGGDHSITSAVLSAFPAGRRLGVLWIDAHPDVMDSYRGAMGREESRWNHACPLRRILELPNVRPDDVLILGVRDFIPAELEFAREHGIEIVYARELARLPAEAVVERIGRRLAGVPELYVSLDIDVLDPAFAPGTGVPIPGGISSRRLLDILYGLCDAERQAQAAGGHFVRLAGLDVVEIAPPLDVRQMTSLVGLELIVALLGLVAVQLALPDLDLLRPAEPAGGRP